jgi:hypothetical protein
MAIPWNAAFETTGEHDLHRASGVTVQADAALRAMLNGVLPQHWLRTFDPSGAGSARALLYCKIGS